MASLIETIFGSSDGRSHEPSLICTGSKPNTLTYDNLRDCVNSIRSTLNDLGLSKSSVCCLSLPNSPSFVAAFLAVVAAGATAAPLNPAMKKDEILFALTDLDADLLIGPAGFHAGANEFANAAENHHCALVACSLSGGQVVLNVVRKSSKKPAAKDTPKGNDFIALALHTSGTTGKPKGVPLRQSNLLASANNVRDAYHLTLKDRSVLIMPLFHIHGIVAGLLTPLVCGSCVIIPEKGLGPDFWSDFREHKATWFTATPSHHKVLLSFPPPSPDVIPRFIRSCSSPLAPSLLTKWLKRVSTTRSLGSMYAIAGVVWVFC